MQIMKLEGPDRVRKRPAVIYGSEDIEGAKHAVKDLLDIFVTEAQLGYCKRLDVTQNGAGITISADDRGIFLGQETGDDTVWKNLFEDFYCPPTNAPSEDGYSFCLCDSSHHILYGDPVAPCATLFPEDVGCFELYCAQCVCKVMDVCSVRNGIKSTLHFEHGHNVGGMITRNTEDANGTGFYFELDQEVFTQTVLPETFFLDTLHSFAVLSPGLSCTYTNQETGKSVVFSYPDGAVDYVKSGAGAVVYHKKIRGQGKERYNSAQYEACLEVTIGPVLGHGNALCFHNFRALTCGGTHYRQMQKKVCKAFNDCFLLYIPESGSNGLKVEMSFEELSKHLSIVLASWCAPRYSCWENGTRLSIANKTIEDMTCDALAEEFCNYVYDNKELLKPIVDAIVQERKGFGSGE